MVKHLGKAGFSLVEIMIAAAILAIIVGSTLTIMSTSGHNTTFQTKIESNDACLSEAHKIIENIKQKGQARVRLSMPVSLLSTTSPPYNFTAAGTDQLGNSNQEAGVTFSDRWPTTDPIYELSGTVYTVRPYLLSMGYMNTLQALYNSNLGFCSNTRGLSSYGDGTIIGNTTSDSLTSSTSYLKIQHFSTTTGATYGGCTAFDIRPPGADEANFGTNVQDPPELNGTKYRDMHPNSVNYRIANKDSTAAINAGFLVTASVTYLDRKGQTQECRVQEKFQYGAQPANNLTLEFEDYVTTGSPANPNNQDDTNIPENINDTVISTTPNTAGWSSGQKPYYDQANNSAHPGIYNLCNATPPSRRVTMRLTRTRSGSIHMCRNLSAQRSPVQGTPASDAANTAAAPAATWFYRQVGTAANSGTGIGFYFRNEAPQRTTFYSTELMQHAYFNAKDRVDTPGDLFVAGLYYPDGTYYCNTGRGCGGSGVTSFTELINRALPRFPSGTYDPGESTGFSTEFLTEYGNARSYFPSDHGATTATAPWVPCETLHNTAICGTGTIEVNGFIPGDYTTTNMSLDGYHMRFNTLPGGCEIHMQVAEVDAGYNIRSSEFREYIQEMAPGNRLCRNATKGDGTFDDYNMNNTASGPLNEHIWFFACQAGAGNPDGVVNCSSATASQDCCMNYPIMPSNDPTAYQPNGLSINPNDCTPKTTAACAVPNGTGQKYCRTNYTWDYCKAVSCNAGYTLQNGQCIVNPPTYNWTFIGFNPGLLECVVDTSWPACTNYFDECKVSPWYAYRCL